MSIVELKFNDFLTFDNSQLLKDFACSQCAKYFTEQDISEKNYCLGVSDYANELNKDNYCDLTQYSLTLWLKSVEHQQCPLVDISNFTFSYHLVNDTCFIQEQGKPERELTIKGATKNGGTWFQLDELTHHWISFHQWGNSYEVFYKGVKFEFAGEVITYYRQVFRSIEPQTSLLTLSFSELDEWVKRSGKWQSRYG